MRSAPTEWSKFFCVSNLASIGRIDRFCAHSEAEEVLPRSKVFKVPRGSTYAFAASLLWRYNASVNVLAAHTISATVIELPTRKRGAYSVSYERSGIQALKA